MHDEIIKGIQQLHQIDISFNLDNLDISIQAFNIDFFPPGKGYDEHMHSIYEFHYIWAGKGWVEFAGKRHTLEKGSFYVSIPGMVHKQIADEEDPMIEYAIRCDIRLRQSMEHKQEEENNYMLDALNRQAVSVVQECYGFEALFESVCMEMCHKRPGYLNQVKSLFIQIVIAALRNYCADETVPYSIQMKDRNSYRLQLINQFIKDNIGRSISCSEIARHLYLSEKQLNRIVREQTDLNIQQYIMKIKVNRVRELLYDTKATLACLAAKTGFASEYHLSNTFKKHIGISPTKFRLELKNKLT